MTKYLISFPGPAMDIPPRTGTPSAKRRTR
jgi:hypothetical protein